MHYTVRHITTCCNPIVHDRAPWHQALATAKSAADEAKQAGLFEVANFKEFNLRLVSFINDLKGEVSSVQGGTPTVSQAVLNNLSLKPNAPDAGFIFNPSYCMPRALEDLAAAFDASARGRAIARNSPFRWSVPIAWLRCIERLSPAISA